MSAKDDKATEFREMFLQRGTQYAYRKGEFIIRPGEDASGIFYIESGLVKAYDITKYGEENMLIVRREQEVFPLIWAMTGNDRHIIYEALVPTTTRFIKREVFQEFISDNSDALSLMLDMAIEMYRIHSERLLNLGYRNVRERLVSFLITTANRFGKLTPEGHTLLDIPLRQQDIGSSISASRESVGREIQNLERKKYLKSTDGYIVHCDLEALKQLL